MEDVQNGILWDFVRVAGGWDKDIGALGDVALLDELKVVKGGELHKDTNICHVGAVLLLVNVHCGNGGGIGPEEFGIENGCRNGG